MVRETRHLWVGNLPENVREEKIIEHFKRYGRVESVKVLPKRGSEGGVAAFVDFVDIKSAQKAHNAINKMGDRDLRTDYNEPGTIPSAARGLDDSLSLSSRGRDVSGFTRAAGGAVYGPPTSLHSRDGRYERRLDGTAESRDRAYDHSAYGHHERPGSSFERQRHYETDYYRDARERTLSTAGSGSGTSSGSGTTVSSGPRYESRAREPFTLASVVHRDLYREDRGRRGERSYRHSRSRSPHSTHSRNPSPQRLASQATRPPRSHSGSGSRSRSSSSDSVSSTSSSTSGSDSSSSSSDDSPARSVQSAAVPAPSALPLSSLDKDEPRKSFGIKVQNLPVRSTDTSLKDGLFHEFKKHGKVTSVQIHGASEERYGLVFFRQQEDQEKALGASKGKLFFGMQIDVTAWNGPETESENEFRPLDERIDEFHPKATRTLFIGNLEKTTTYHDLLNIFQRFGEIVDIDIKKVNGAPQYAFLQYCDIASVCKAIKKMDGEYLGNNRLKLGFGKSMPTTCVWLDGLASNTTEQFLTRHFCRYGHVVKVVFDRMKGMALILYNNIEYAQAAVKDTKGWKIGGSKIKVDFANQESQMAFYRSMQASGQDIRDFYDILSERRDDRRTQYEFQAERQYYENVRTPGTYTEDPRRKYPARSREFYTEWDPYQGDYYDPQYFEDPREYREYRADPYEQDIRKYSYLQRERERERERFETDRGRDHGRRTIERSQSPSHVASRRPASPTASPSLSERIPSDSDRRICCRSSERSGSCSSISPPRFEKLEKARTERYNKTDKLEKDRVFEVERGNLVEKEKRAGRKDRGDKDKSEKQRLKKLKIASPIIQACETEPELERDVSPESVLRINSPKDGRDCESNSIGLSLERQARLGELPEDSTDQLDSPYLKMELEGAKSENSSSLTKMSDDGSLDLDELKEQKQVLSENEHGRGKCRDSDDGDEHFVHIDQNNICTKQIEQSSWLQPKLGDPDKLVKFENPPSNETHDFEKDYSMYDVGKPIQDIANDDLSSCKRKKLENFGFEIVSAKRERNFASSQKLNDDIYQSITSSMGHGHFSATEEDETAHISVSVINKERKSSPTTDDKFSHTESLKNSLGLSASHFQSSDTEFPKLKTNLLGCDEELMQRWERRIKSDSLRMEMTFPSDIAKRESICKHLGQDLEPGEVQSDSDDDGENKHISPKSSSSLSYILRERDERMTDLKLSGSLEKNKFYSFALDKTITPDTKALLERAKTLYSSREDNWSFLPSRFPTSHSCSDKDKVELAPRPIPSWYMKKKKIRTDSDEKLHNKKEELKPQDQERQDLFASRFLHSSIFEQDSRRLQHLERKDQDLETGVGRPFAKPGATEAQPESGIGDIPQEPIVLFHSRFLELQQQKDKDHPPPDTENDSIVVEIKRDEVQNWPPQRSNTPQPNIIRDMVLQSHSSPQGSVSGGGGSSVSEEDPRHFNQALSRPSVPQLQSDVMMIHSDHRGLHPSIRMDQYRDMHQRILMHQQLGEQAAVDVRQSRTSETGTTSSSNISGPSKSPIMGKSIELSSKESLKPLEGKLIHPPSNEGRIRGVHASSPVMVSHPHGVQLMHPGSAGSFPVYREMRGFPSQFTGHPSPGHSLANQGITSSQVPPESELVHRGKMSQSHGGGNDSKPESSHLRHATSTDLSHISRISGDTISPSYQSPMTSPMALTHKPELSLQKGPPPFLPTPPPAVTTSSSLQPRPDAKMEHSGHRSVDMVQLLTKYPIVWQGLLALKNDQAAVQLHFVSGNTILAQRSLPPPEGGPLLRIVQRMRLEASQLDSVARRMTVENDYCLLLALPCGRDQEDVLGQTQALKSGFITYLQAKQAAGIINVPNPGSNQPAYVVQIFPPCEFSESHLSRLAPDLLNSISSISPHLMIVIASV
ncbi:msx2-interacting protein [Enoplosus armatus]|uniref:msx2-interacting protein n=1 Tax=Enoplosus armatus TaxID=215367 RepID=UPI003995FA97